MAASLYIGIVTLTKHLSDEKTHANINGKLFKKLNNVNHALNGVEHAKLHIQRNKPSIVVFLPIQNAKLGLWELYYKLITKFCNPNQFEMSEMDTHALYLPRAKKEVEVCIPPEAKTEWEQREQSIAIFVSLLTQLESFSERSLSITKKTWQAIAWSFQKNRIYRNVMFI